MNKKILSIIGCALGVVGLLVAIYSLIYVCSLSSQQMFAVPLFYAIYFTAFTLPATVAGLVISLIARKKDKSHKTLVGIIASALGLIVVIIVALVGANSLSHGDFTSLSNAIVYKDMMYADIVSELHTYFFNGEVFFE